ncbi:hypothetical protein [Paraoerskovia marina]|uniref:hypothetical protein n=1 Tax=Paraoerskovia marina TaxID=545619 RepID=UPI0012DD126E|nr:hypothetical protein [Paraoerskovia marina]
MRSSARTRALSLAVLAGIVAPLAAGCALSETATTSDGACEAARVSVEPGSVAPGKVLRITGQGYVDGCADNPEVVDGTQAPDESSTAMSDISVVWSQGDVEIELGRVEAGPDGEWSLDATAPPDARSGEAHIGAGTSEPATVTVTP